MELLRNKVDEQFMTGKLNAEQYINLIKKILSSSAEELKGLEKSLFFKKKLELKKKIKIQLKKYNDIKKPSIQKKDLKFQKQVIKLKKKIPIVKITNKDLKKEIKQVIEPIKRGFQLTNSTMKGYANNFKYNLSEEEHQKDYVQLLQVIKPLYLKLMN